MCILQLRNQTARQQEEVPADDGRRRQREAPAEDGRQRQQEAVAPMRGGGKSSALNRQETAE
jgi:hypothetical protein